jgi:hypothetical protein
MRIGLIALILITFGQIVWAANSAVPFADAKKKKVLPSLDLISESSQKQIITEASVQKDQKTSDMSFSVGFGQLNPKALTIETKDSFKKYGFNEAINQVVAEFSAFPYHAKGKWGGAVSMGYGSTQDFEGEATRLHLIPIQFSAGYKLETGMNQKVSPQVLIGHGEMIYFQRGADQFNTSESSGYEFASLGVNLNLNAIGWISNSRNQMDLSFRADQVLTVESSKRDFRGTNFNLGLSINL